VVIAAGLDRPLAPWLFQYVFSAAGLVLLAVLLFRSFRRRRLSYATLLFLSAVTMFWQEFYADWGAYLLYTNRFALMPWHSALTSPNKPWFMPISYGWYFTVIFTLIPFAVLRLRARRPDMPLVVAVLVVAVPFFYLWDAVVEFSSVGAGYWTYANTVGPALHFHGTRVGLLHPLEFFTAYGALMAFLLTWRADGSPTFERLLGAHRRPPGWNTELRRLGAWIITMNAVYWFGFTVWLLLVRHAFGAANRLVP